MDAGNKDALVATPKFKIPFWLEEPQSATLLLRVSNGLRRSWDNNLFHSPFSLQNSRWGRWNEDHSGKEVENKKKIILALPIKKSCLGRHARKTLRSEWLIFQKTELDMDRWEDSITNITACFRHCQNQGTFLWGGVPACTTPLPPRIKQPHLANRNTTEIMIIFSAKL